MSENKPHLSTALLDENKTNNIKSANDTLKKANKIVNKSHLNSTITDIEKIINELNEANKERVNNIINYLNTVDAYRDQFAGNYQKIIKNNKGFNLFEENKIDLIKKIIIDNIKDDKINNYFDDKNEKSNFKLKEFILIEYLKKMDENQKLFSQYLNELLKKESQQ